MSIRPLKDYPILRLAIPLAAGVFFAGTFPRLLSQGAYVAGILMLALGVGILLFRKAYGGRWMFGTCIFGLFFLLGALRMSHRWEEVNRPWPDERRVYQAVVQEMPEEKPRSVQCKAVLPGGENVIFYLAKDSASRSLTMGDRLWIYTRIRPPQNTGATGDFDYASYLLYKGISGTAYVPRDTWTKGQPAPLTWKQRALEVRRKVVESYREWGIGEEQLPVLSALTVGYKGDLSDEVREAYSVAGIAHVLALSGMHIGFLWLMLSVLLKPLEVSRPLRWLKWGLAAALLWAFAFVAGLEASVVRAVIMCMLLEGGRVTVGKSLSMNTLAVAALFMLVYNPFYLYDVSFQLSFLAVLSILLVAPALQRKCPVENRWVRGVWGVMSVSVAAQLGTAPLVMYYFSNFSVYFLLANLGVSLWVPCIIYTAFALPALVLLPPLQEGAVWLLDGMVMCLNAFAAWVSGWPGASLSAIRVHQAEVWGMYVWLAACLWYAFTRRRKALLAAWGAVAVWLGVHCLLYFFE